MDFYKPQEIFFCQEGEISVFQNLIKVDISEYLLLMQYLAWFAPFVVVLQVDLPPALFWEWGFCAEYRVHLSSGVMMMVRGWRASAPCQNPQIRFEPRRVG